MQTMKKVLIFAGFMAIAAMGRAQEKTTAIAATEGTATAPAAAPDVLFLKEKVHNFGKIPQGRPTTYTFEIVNRGSEPLVLANVMASCGCTTPEWSRDPIAPGATASIKVGYNAYAEG